MARNEAHHLSDLLESYRRARTRRLTVEALPERPVLPSLAVRRGTSALAPDVEIPLSRLLHRLAQAVGVRIARAEVAVAIAGQMWLPVETIED